MLLPVPLCRPIPMFAAECCTSSANLISHGNAIYLQVPCGWRSLRLVGNFPGSGALASPVARVWIRLR